MTNAPAPAAAAGHNVEVHGFGEWGRDAGGRVLYAAAIAFSVFQIWTAAFSPLHAIVVRSIHVGFLLLLTFALLARARRRSALGHHASWLLGILGFVAGLYWYFEHDRLILNADDPSLLDFTVAGIVVVLVFEAGRRVMGIALPLICATFFAYAVFGHLLIDAPFGFLRDIAHRGYDFEQVLGQMYIGTDGIYATPIGVSSSYIFLFILFGSFLERAGMIKLFNDLALGTVGHTRGGPAKVSVISSALMGTINGSGVANVVTTGQFTIPLMKKFGYRAEFAGGVEATASMGGQIMPPVMGAVAFIMAETLNVSYAAIVTAAVIPAFLYFFTAFWMVHLEAGRAGLLGLPKSECPNAWQALRKNVHLLLPLAALVYLLFSGFTPLFAGSSGLALTAVLILGAPAAALLGPTPLRIVVWLAIGTFCAWAISVAETNGIRGAWLLIGIITALALACFASKGGRETLRLSRDALADGARNALSVGIACALVGIIIGVMTLTGIGTNFTRFVVSIGQDSLFLSLVLTMIASLILGMGIPTIPNYIIVSSLAAPALKDLGVDLLVSHMFVFYFGILADLTPPVALAAFAAAPIAQASGMRIGFNAVKIAIAGFVIPFMAVYDPALMLQKGGHIAQWGARQASIVIGNPGLAYDIGYGIEVVYIVAKTMLSIMLWGAAATGFLRIRLTILERIWACAAAFLLVATIPLTDQLGFAAAFALLAWHWWQAKAAAPAPAR